MNDLLRAALNYREMGLSVVPVFQNKGAANNWAKFQRELLDEQEINRIFRWRQVQGVAIVCGDISGGLGVIDIDSKNDLSGNLFSEFLSRMEHAFPGLPQIPLKEVTRNNGYHLFYRCSEPGRKMVLARRPATEAERLLEPEVTLKVLIENIANGGYVIVEPTAGYRLFQGSFANIPFVSQVQRDVLFSVARSFNAYHPVIHQPKSPPLEYSGTESPFTAYNLDPNRREKLIALLQQHDWTMVYATDLRTYFRRPGKTDHRTSGDYHHTLNLFAVFSPNTAFKVGKGYRPAAVYTLLECGGDFSIAAKRLIEAGYGIPYRKRA